MSGQPAAAHTSVYASRPITKPPDWHGLVAWDMLLNNLTTGLFLTAALGELAVPALFTPVADLAYPLALVFLFLDLACLVLDLGDPWRFHHMLRVFKPSSPMSLGTWSLTLYSLPLTVLVATELFPRDLPVVIGVRRIALGMGLLPAFASAVYKGVLLSTTAQPGWRDARWLAAYLTSSALMLGCAELLALAIFQGEGAVWAILHWALVPLVILNLCALLLLSRELAPTLAGLYSTTQAGWLAVACFLAGLGLPLFLLIAATSQWVLLASVVLLIAGSLVVRFALVKLPHAIPHPELVGSTQ